MKKITLLLMTLLLTVSLFPGLQANAQTSHEKSAAKDFAENSEAVEKALDQVIDQVGDQMAAGNEDIFVTEYVEEINQNVSIEFHSEDVKSNSSNGIVTMAALPSGKKSYSAKVNAWGFNHELSGVFVYSGGKVQSATKEVRAGGVAFSHTRPSSITKLNPSVWSVHSASKHKWLGVVGNYSGLGYTSYITIELYGSGTSSLQRASYKTGI